MGYYRGGDCLYGRGDYYRGDYYRGDPGIFSGIGKALATVAKGVAGFATGGIGGAIRAVVPQRNPLQGTALAPAPMPPPFQPGFGIQTPGLRFGAFGPPPPELQQPVGTMTPQGFIAGCQLKGTRPNKSGYYKQVVKGNPFSAVYIPKGSVCVKTRRMNFANPRALRKAVRRAQSFARYARRVMTFVDARAPRGRARFKKKR